MTSNKKLQNVAQRKGNCDNNQASFNRVRKDRIESSVLFR